MSTPSTSAVRTFLRLCFTGTASGLFLVPAAAQSQCVHKLDRVDEFTRQRDLEITASAFSHGPTFSWRAWSQRRVLRLQWQQPGHVPAVVFQGDSLMLKLENDSVVVLTSDDTFTGKPLYDREGREITTGVYDYRVTPEQLQLIAKHWVHKLRIYFRDGYQELDVVPDPSWQLAVSRSAGCFLDALGDKAPAAPISTTGPGPEKP